MRARGGARRTDVLPLAFGGWQSLGDEAAILHWLSTAARCSFGRSGLGESQSITRRVMATLGVSVDSERAVIRNSRVPGSLCWRNRDLLARVSGCPSRLTDGWVLLNSEFH